MTDVLWPYQVMPPLAEEEFVALKAAILDWGGVRDAVVLTPEGDILDGHHRVRAWAELRAEGHALPPYPTVARTELAGEAEKRTAARTLNLTRRHVTAEQKRAIVAEQLRDTPRRANRWIASDLGAHHRTVISVRAELVAAGEIEDYPTLVDKHGRAHPAVKDGAALDKYPVPQPMVEPAGLVERLTGWPESHFTDPYDPDRYVLKLALHPDAPWDANGDRPAVFPTVSGDPTIADLIAAGGTLAALPRESDELHALWRLYSGAAITRFTPAEVFDALRPDRREPFIERLGRLLPWLVTFHALITAQPAPRMRALGRDADGKEKR